MRIFTMSDIHGHYKEFIRLLQYINFNSEDRLVILGDILDRGPNSFEVFKYIKDKPNIQLLRGNHELMFLDYQREISSDSMSNRFADLWYRNGAKNTFDSFMNNVGKLKTNPLNDLESYLLTTKLFIVYKDYIMLHAGYSFSDLNICNKTITKELNSVEEYSLVWDRDFWKSVFLYNEGVIPDNKTVICGHTGIHKQFPNGIPKVLNIPNTVYRKFDNGSSVIDLDLSTVLTGMLGIFEINTREFIYIDLNKNIQECILE